MKVSSFLVTLVAAIAAGAPQSQSGYDYSTPQDTITHRFQSGQPQHNQNQDSTSFTGDLFSENQQEFGSPQSTSSFGQDQLGITQGDSISQQPDFVTQQPFQSNDPTGLEFHVQDSGFPQVQTTGFRPSQSPPSTNDALFINENEFEQGFGTGNFLVTPASFEDESDSLFVTGTTVGRPLPINNFQSDIPGTIEPSQQDQFGFQQSGVDVQQNLVEQNFGNHQNNNNQFSGQFSGFDSQQGGNSALVGTSGNRVAQAPAFVEDHSTKAEYDFSWDVNDENSGNYYGHQESRNGVHTQGSYYVRLPDTRLMTVEYFADETGYHPTITFQGEARYDEPVRRTESASQIGITGDAILQQNARPDFVVQNIQSQNPVESVPSSFGQQFPTVNVNTQGTEFLNQSPNVGFAEGDIQGTDAPFFSQQEPNSPIFVQPNTVPNENNLNLQQNVGIPLPIFNQQNNVPEHRDNVQQQSVGVSLPIFTQQNNLPEDQGNALELINIPEHRDNFQQQDVGVSLPIFTQQNNLPENLGNVAQQNNVQQQDVGVPLPIFTQQNNLPEHQGNFQQTNTGFSQQSGLQTPQVPQQQLFVQRDSNVPSRDQSFFINTNQQQNTQFQGNDQYQFVPNSNIQEPSKLYTPPNRIQQVNQVLQQNTRLPVSTTISDLPSSSSFSQQPTLFTQSTFTPTEAPKQNIQTSGQFSSQNFQQPPTTQNFQQPQEIQDNNDQVFLNQLDNQGFQTQPIRQDFPAQDFHVQSVTGSQQVNQEQQQNLPDFGQISSNLRDRVQTPIIPTVPQRPGQLYSPPQA